MAEAEAAKGERIAKRLARAGLCSRRDAERWIAEGRVAVDGKVLASPALTVTEANDIRVDGKPLPAAEPARLWRYHKPAGLVTTHRDEQGRATVFDRLPPELPRVVSVGRLDLNSEGLLLLTNDGGLARDLELPARGWLRRYRVRVHGVVEAARLDHRQDRLWADPRHARPRARGEQCLAHRQPARGQEPRDPPRHGASGIEGDAPHPRRLWPVSAGRAAARRRRGSAAPCAARAARHRRCESAAPQAPCGSSGVGIAAARSRRPRVAPCARPATARAR